MEWTTEHPEKDGYYWLYPAHDEYPELIEFHVNTWKDRPNSYWFLSFGTDGVLHPDEYPDALWTGPVIPPAK